MKLRGVLIMAAFLAALFCFTLTASADEDCDHDWYETGEYEQVDGDYHQQWYECYYCGARELGDLQGHDYYCTYNDVPIDKTYHGEEYECMDCGRTKIINKQKHDWSYDYTSRYATLFKKGHTCWYCSECYRSGDSYPSWKRGSYYSVSYNIDDHSLVYKNSKSMNVWLHRSLKGGVIKVKIGNKTYKKKIKNSKLKQKVKIKKSKYGKKITVKLYYKGKLVGTDKCNGGYIGDHVLYGNKIKKGMTKKKVKCLYYWGPPDSASSASGGWSYWYYNDGSYVDFKNGKVKYWYNVFEGID